MQQDFQRTLFICLAAALCCAGCAKHDVVKQDQLIPTAAPAAGPKTAALPANAIVPEVKAAATQADLMKSTSNESQAAALKKAGEAGGNDALPAALEKVFFAFNSPTLTPAARATLTKNAEFLRTQGDAKIRIEGNCDELGSDDYNLSLGESRAKSAMNYLHSLGIQSDRISIISYGKEKPADLGHDEASRARNRRDEFILTSK